MSDIQLQKVPQGLVIIAPGGGKKAEPCGADGLFTTGKLEGERGSSRHNTTSAIENEQERCCY